MSGEPVTAKFWLECLHCRHYEGYTQVDVDPKTHQGRRQERMGCAIRKTPATCGRVPKREEGKDDL